MPFVKFMLSGGVNIKNFTEYLSVNASCILIGSSILKKELVVAGDWNSVTELARKFVREIETYKKVSAERG